MVGSCTAKTADDCREEVNAPSDLATTMLALPRLRRGVEHVPHYLVAAAGGLLVAVGISGFFTMAKPTKKLPRPWSAPLSVDSVMLRF
jgi:hypothetical protein